MDAATPSLQRCAALDTARHRVWLQREDLGPLGTFKWRGAIAHCAALARSGATGVTAASTGNFAAAVAYAAAQHGLVAEVVVPEGTSAAKLARLESIGATVHLRGAVFTDAEAAARVLAAERGYAFFEDGGSAEQLEGTAAIGAELAAAAELPGAAGAAGPTGAAGAAGPTGAAGPDAGSSLAAVLVPVACGALAGGLALGMRRAGGSAAVIGVQARACSRLAARFHGEPEPPSRPRETLADGLADDRLVEPAFSTCLAELADVLVVDEADLRAAMRAIHAATGTLPEGAGAAAAAGLARHPDRVPAGDVALILSGANVAPELAAEVLAA